VQKETRRDSLTLVKLPFPSIWPDGNQAQGKEAAELFLSFFFLMALWFELTALHLLGRYSTISSAFFCVNLFLE
jgi:hypothetical protein